MVEIAKYIFVSHTGFFFGGAEKCLFDFLVNTKIPKAEIEVIIPHLEKNGLSKKLKDKEISFIEIFKDRDKSPFEVYTRSPLLLFAKIKNRIAYSINLFNYLKHQRPNVLYLNTISTGTESIIAKLLKIPSIVHIHGLDGKWKFRIPILKIFPTEFITVSEQSKRELIDAGIKSKVSVVYNGIIYKKIQKTKKRKILTVGNIANVSKRKGIDTFCEIAKQITTTIPNVNFINIGKFPEDSFFNNLKKEYGDLMKAKKIIFKGFIDNAESQLKNFDVFILPSRKEGFPLVVLEAMNQGLPIIAFNKDGMKEQIFNEKNGYLVNSTDEFVSKLVLLLKSKSKRNIFGRNSRKIVKENFSFKDYIDGIEKIVEKYNVK